MPARETLRSWLHAYDFTSLPRPVRNEHDAPQDGWVLMVEIDE